MATTATLHPDLQRFPPGTTVKAYKRSNFLPAAGPVSGAPQGTQDASATVAADGSVSFTGLTNSTDYLLYASVSGEDRYARFATKDTPATGSTSGGVYTGAQDFSGATVTLPSGLVVPADSVDTTAIQNLAVTTGKIANGAVTAAKVAADVATQAELDAVSAAGEKTSSSTHRLLAAPWDPQRMNGGGPNLNGYVMGCLVEIGKTGTLRELITFVRVASGNYHLGIYDNGEASAGNISLLYDSGQIVAAGTDVYQTGGDANLAVTAGQLLHFVVHADNNTLSIGRITHLGVGQNKLPSGFLPASGGLSCKLNWGYARGSYSALPATISEAQRADSASSYWVGARLV